MAYVLIDDFNEIWNQLEDHSWYGLKEALEEHQGELQGISDDLADMMVQASEYFENQGRSFPDSPDELSKIMNDEIESSHYSQHNIV